MSEVAPTIPRPIEDIEPSRQGGVESLSDTTLMPEVPPNPTPLPYASPEQTKPPLKIVVNDVSSAAEDRAQDVADDRFNEETMVESVEPLDFGEGKMQKARAFLGTMAKTFGKRVKQIAAHPTQEGSRLWKRTFDGYYKRKYRSEALDEMLQEANIYIDKVDGQHATEQLRDTVIERSLHKDAQQMLSTERGEKLERLDERSDEPARIVHNRLIRLVSQIATGELTEDNFNEEANRQLAELAREHPDLLGKGRMFADNLLDVAKGVAQTVDHLEGEERLDQLDQTLQSIETHVGISKLGQRTEARYTRSDKIVKAIEETPFGNVAAVATVASATLALGKVMAQKGTSAAIKATAIFGGFMVGAGVIAGAKRSKEIADDRAQHSRDRAAGEQFDPYAKRRAKLEQARYETVSASDLYGTMQSLFEMGEAGELKRLKDLTPEGFQSALLILAEMKVRDQMSDEQAIDLIHFSDVTKIDAERFELLQTEVYAEAALHEFFEAHADEIGEFLHVPESSDVDFDTLLTIYSQATESSIEQDITSRDRVFRKLKAKEVALAGLMGATAAGVAGAITQEVTAELPVIGKNVNGLFEKQSVGKRSTLLAGIFKDRDSSKFSGNLTDVGGSGKFADVDGFTPKQDSAGNWFIEQQGTGKTIPLQYDSQGLLTSGTKSNLHEMGFDIHSAVDQVELSGQMQKFEFGHNTFVFPKEYNLHEVTDGQWQILDGNGKVVDSMQLNFDGSLTQQSITELQAGGVGVSDVTNLVESTKATTVPTADEFVFNNFDKTTAVHRTLWYGNDTPSPDFDLNELRTHAGGAGDSWYDAQGNVVLDISAMKPDGSFQDGQSINPFDAVNEGRLSLAVSASKNTQSHVFDFKFSTTPDGRTIATIPADSPVHQLFGEQNGQRTFNGAYLEVTEHTGNLTPKGEDVKILGTYVGSNDASNLTDTVRSTTEYHTTTFDIKPPPEPVEVITYNPNPIVEVPPVVPITLRRGLETPTENQPEQPLALRSNEIELWRGGVPAVIEQYKKREIEYYNPRSTDIEQYIKSNQTNQTSSKPKNDDNSSSDNEDIPETVQLNGTTYSKQELSSSVAEYLSQLSETSMLWRTLHNQEIDSADEFVQAIEEQLRVLNELNTDPVTGQVNEKGLRVGALKLFPDREIFSFGRLVTFNGASGRAGMPSKPGLIVSSNAARSVLKMMFRAARKT